jgi:hypothetical protein
VALSLGPNVAQRGCPNPLELGVDVAHRTGGCGIQKAGHCAIGPYQREQEPKVVRVRYPPQPRSMLAQPGAVSGSCGRVRDRAGDLDDLAHGRDREAEAEQVGD